MLKKLHLVPKLRASIYLEAFLLSSATTVVAIRCFPALDFTGNQTMLAIQILCGGFLMTAAVVFFLTFFNGHTNVIAAILGGIGLGIVLDEVEKFITFNNDAVLQPVVPVAYFSSIFIFLLGKHLLVSRQPSARDYLVNSLALIQEASISPKKDREFYEHIEYLLKKAGKKNPPVQHLHQLVQSKIKSLPVTAENRRISKAIGDYYRKLVEKKILYWLAAAFFILYGAFNVYNTVQPLFDGSILPFNDLSTLEQFELFSAIIITVITLGGLLELIFSRLHAYRTLELSVYLSIFVLQVFIFSNDQITGIIGLVTSIIAVFVLKSLMRLEEHRMHMHVLGRIKSHDKPDTSKMPTDER